MLKYKTIKQLGDGSFGVVTLAESEGKLYAIKQMKRKYHSWEECLQLKELRTLRQLNHPNIIKLREVVRQDALLYFIFDYCSQGSLYDLLQNHEGVDWSFQCVVNDLTLPIVHALSYLHSLNIQHRDVKCENILIHKVPDSNKLIPKLADFGLARPIVDNQPLTEYISTLWYRSPELLVLSTNSKNLRQRAKQERPYTESIDIWALGCVLYETVTLRPLFPGTSALDMLHKIVQVLGSHTSIGMVRTQVKRPLGFDLTPINTTRSLLASGGNPLHSQNVNAQLARPPYSTQILQLLSASVCYADTRISAKEMLELSAFESSVQDEASGLKRLISINSPRSVQVITNNHASKQQIMPQVDAAKNSPTVVTISSDSTVYDSAPTPRTISPPQPLFNQEQFSTLLPEIKRLPSQDLVLIKNGSATPQQGSVQLAQIKQDPVVSLEPPFITLLRQRSQENTIYDAQLSVDLQTLKNQDDDVSFLFTQCASDVADERAPRRSRIFASKEPNQLFTPMQQHTQATKKKNKLHPVSMNGRKIFIDGENVYRPHAKVRENH